MPPGGTETRGRPIKRFSARRKREAVERLIRGEDIEMVSRDLGVTAAQLSQWRDKAIRAAETALKNREQPDERNERITRLKAKIGELTMDGQVVEHCRESVERGDAGRNRRRTEK